MPRSSERTALYRFYDERDRLLYVGISKDPDQRWREHQQLSPWSRQISRREVEWLTSRRTAEVAEVAAIKSERPAHNNRDNFETAQLGNDWPSLAGIKRGKADALAELIRQEIRSARWRPGQKTPSREVMAAAVGVSLSTAETATDRLLREGVLVHRGGLGLFVSRRAP
ncbi:GIY-YIG nuclease family protein [Streptomyces sp. NBRC 109706]|uniref:GIY-YIG nuclease family protein n=1 Tax=Streptomyces sp. NBRC 109706 TaxID=1550035 RepID=UPI0007865265|nr:GntR family transcriptional regulator [Streptomyces sp. NBRC 109706]